MRSVLVIFSAFILMRVLVSCHYGNAQEYEKGNIHSGGWNYIGWGDFRYCSLCIGTDEMPFYKSATQFAVKFSNGEVLKSTEFTIENIKKLEGIKLEGKQRCNLEGKEIKRYILRQSSIDSEKSDYADIEFDFDGLDFISFIVDCERSPTELGLPNEINFCVGTVDGKKFYPVPLRRWQLEEIFGKADNLRTKWTE